MILRLKSKSPNVADDKLATFVAAYFLLQSLNLFIKLGLGGSTWSSIGLRVVMGFLLLRCLGILWNRNSAPALLVEFILALLFAFTYLLGTYNEEFVSILFNAMAVFAPMAICVFALDSYDSLLSRLYSYAWISLVALWVTCIINRLGNYDYIMSLGYSITFHTIILLDNFFSKHRKFDLIGCAISLLFILAVGSRGPLLVILVYVLLKILFSNSLSKNYKAIFSILLISILAVLWLNGDRLILWMYDYLSSIGYKSRTLRSILTSTFTNDSGRSRFYSYYTEMIKQRPLLGYGLAGGWNFAGGYPHNIAIEMLLSFGYPLGVISLGTIIFIILRSIFTRDPESQRLTMIFFALSVSLLFSGSFVTTPEFYILIAVCIKSIRGKRYKAEAEYG